MTKKSHSSGTSTRGYGPILAKMNEKERIYDIVIFDHNLSITDYYIDLCEALPSWLKHFSDRIAENGKVYFLEMNNLCSTLENLEEADREALGKLFWVQSVFPPENPLYYSTAVYADISDKERININSAPLTYDSTTHLFSMWTRRAVVHDTMPIDNGQEILDYTTAIRTRLGIEKSGFETM